MWWGKSLRANLSEPTNQGRFPSQMNIYEHLQSLIVQSICTLVALLDSFARPTPARFSSIYLLNTRGLLVECHVESRVH